MELPPGINFPNMTRETHCLRILKNLYGGKESGRTWFIHLRSTLTTKLGYSQSKFDECVFFHGSTIFFVYTDDGIFIDPSPKQINIRLTEMSQIFDIQDQGDLHEYLGIKIDNHSKGSLEMKQPHLIDSILQDFNLLNDKFEPLHSTKIKHLPSLATKRIGSDSTGKPLNVDWDYRSVIGKLNYLEKSTQPDISFVVHQLARFVTAPKESHGHAVKHLGQYLLGTRDMGIILSPTSSMSLTCYVDADFAGNWDAQEASDNPDTARS
jgi:Reverse transcriptase (RNA-dependent DNA polymerase)